MGNNLNKKTTSMKSFFITAMAGVMTANADPLYSSIKSSVMNLN